MGKILSILGSGLALSDNGLLHRPAQICHYDEMGMVSAATSHNVVAKINYKPCSITSRDKTQVTVLSCVNTAGLLYLLLRFSRTGKWRSTRNALWCF